MDQEITRRIRLDFTKRESDILSYIQTYFPTVSTAQLKEWENSKALESHVIDSEKCYFNRAAENLFRIDAKARERKETVDGIQSNPRELTLKKHIPEIIESIQSKGSTESVTKRFKMSFSLTVKADIIPSGEVIRCWLPYPRTDERRQRNVELINTSENRFELAPDTSAHKTIYQEKKTEQGKPTRFSVTYTFELLPEWFSIEADRLLAYNEQSVDYQQFCNERAPHILFSDAIKELSEQIVAQEENSYRKAKLIFAFLRTHYPWASAREYSTIENIPEYVIQNRHGDCGQIGLLFITLCRYNGIPARWQSGFMLHPNSKNLHDWAEIYFEGVGWIPVDPSFGIQTWATDDETRYFFLGGQDAYHLTINNDYSQPLSPEKHFMRSETVDFQRGEVEWRNGNLYFDQWDYEFTVEEI